MSERNLVALLQLTDPALPIGGFAHSAGLETYVQLGIVKDKTTARAFVTAQLSRNILFTDAALVSLAFNAVQSNDIVSLLELDELCTAVKLPKEVRQASQKLGMRLLKIFLPLCSSSLAEQYGHAIHNGKTGGNYPVVFGMFAAVMGLTKKESLTGFFYNCATGMVTNSVKLIPMGQQDGQEILFSLHPLIETLVTQALEPDRELIGLCCAGFDIRCMQHEQLYSRLYMS